MWQRGYCQCVETQPWEIAHMLWRWAWRSPQVVWVHVSVGLFRMAVLSLTDWNINWYMERKHDIQTWFSSSYDRICVLDRYLSRMQTAVYFLSARCFLVPGRVNCYLTGFLGSHRSSYHHERSFCKSWNDTKFLAVDKWFRIAVIKWNFVLYFFLYSIFFLPSLVVQKLDILFLFFLVVSFEIYGYLNIKISKINQPLHFLPPNARSNASNLIIFPLAYMLFLSIVITCKYRYMKVKRKDLFYIIILPPETVYNILIEVFILIHPQCISFFAYFFSPIWDPVFRVFSPSQSTYFRSFFRDSKLLVFVYLTVSAFWPHPYELMFAGSWILPTVFSLNYISLSPLFHYYCWEVFFRHF